MEPIKIRCSQIGKIMSGRLGLTDKQAKDLNKLQNKKTPLTELQAEKVAYLKEKRDNPELSKTVISYLAELETERRTGRSKEILTKQMEKGIEQEEEAITLLSSVTGNFYVKNERSFENEYLTGTPDILSHIVRDTKCSWDIYSFPHDWSYTLDPMYYWQLQGYMALTGYGKASLDYCLVNTPENIIEREKRAIMWMHPDAYDIACKEIDKLNRYDDIPEEDRVFSIEIERNDDDIKAIYERIDICREFWNKKMRRVEAV